MKTLLAAFAAILASLCAAPASAQDVYAITDVTLIPMDTERRLPNRTVIVANGRIAAIDPAESTSIPAGATRIEGRGRYLMPGLAEMHAHVPPNPNDAQWAEDVLFLYAANGVTFARSMLGAPHHLALREQAASGEIVSPRLHLAGPSLNGNSVASPEDGRRMVAEQKAAGYDFLKIHPGLDRPRYDAIAEAAKAAGIPFGGHVPDAVGIERAMAAGQRTVDHLDGYMQLLVPEGTQTGDAGFFGFNLTPHAEPARIPEAVRMTREAGVWNVPTESLIHNILLTAPDGRVEAREDFRYVPAGMRRSWMEALANAQGQPDFDIEKARRFAQIRARLIHALHDGGAGLLLGSDAPQILNVPGARADMILLEADPLADVANVQRRAGVMLGGRWLSEERIRAGLAEIVARHAE